MRVAIVCPYSLAVPGGVQQQVLGLAAALGRAGEDVTVLAPTGPAAYRGGPAAGYGVVLVGHSLRVPANGSRAPVSLSLASGRRTVEALRQLRPDVVHVHEPFVPAPALAATLAHLAPTLATFHRAGGGAGYRAAGLGLRLVAGRIDACVAVSGAARDTVALVLGRDPGCEVLWNGVDLDRFAEAVPAPAKVPTALFVGRHEPRKGLAVLLEAFALVPGEVALWVAGEGPLTAGLRRRWRDERVEWLGRVDDDELAARLAGASVLVAPSLRGESFGLVLLEAMAAGTAVLASDLPGYRAAAGEAARFFPPGDAGALASLLSEVLAEPALARQLVDAGHRLAVARSFRQLATAYRARYARLAARPA